MSARLTVSEVDTRAETITLTGTRDNLRRVEAWLHGDVDVVPAGTVEKLQEKRRTITVDVDVLGIPELRGAIETRIAIETAALRRERDALARCLAAVPALFQKSAGEIYGHAYAAGHEDERDAQRLEGDWSQP